ncbi:unnamed protein product [Spirodela intermedia]|uniref:Uncharacterized protein n=1 Tax=Spirodela intermedia TaxID=51605 RepID=A0A7I8IRC3_SPIIN|nr:unnamed protein product [Spirodela intermedia]CAA6660106.1 unnamed protein product [Spirodela intermedia]
MAPDGGRNAVTNGGEMMKGSSDDNRVFACVVQPPPPRFQSDAIQKTAVGRVSPREAGDDEVPAAHVGGTGSKWRCPQPLHATRRLITVHGVTQPSNGTTMQQQALPPCASNST